MSYLYIPMLYRYSRLVHVWHYGENNFYYKCKLWLHLSMGFYYIMGIQLNFLHVMTNLEESSSFAISEAVYTSICGMNIYYNCVVTVLVQKRSLHLFEELQDFTEFGEPPMAKKHMKTIDILNFLIYMYIVLGIIMVLTQTMYIKYFVCPNGVTIELTVYCTGHPVQLYYYVYSIQEGFVYYFHLGLAWYMLTYLLEAGALSGAACFTAFELVIVRLDHLKEKIAEIFEVEEKKESKDRLRNCIRYHIYIAGLVDRVNECYEKFLAPCQLTYSVIIGLSFLTFLTYHELKAFINVMGWVLAIFLNCVCGERMMHKSVEIASALYDTKWYEASPSIRKDIAFMMMRAQKPFYLKTGPYGIFSLLTFKSILKGGYTYATMKTQTST